MTIQAQDTGPADAAVQTLEASSTQSQSSSLHERAGSHVLANLLMLASLGLIPSPAPTASLVLTYPGQSESTYSVRALRETQELEQVTEVLTRIHDTLLSEAKELEPDARQILSEQLWNLYIT